MFADDENQWQLIRFRFAEKRLIEAFAFLRSKNIEPILIKGWAAAQNYPNPSVRFFNDLDLMVNPANYNEIIETCKDYQLKNPIDFHRGARHLDNLDFNSLFADSRLVKCQNTEIRILSPEDHLRILCVHWLNDGGIKREKLWDIFYAVQNRSADFDWNRCLDATSPKRRKWIVCAILLAEKYLDLDLTDTPIALEAGNLPEWVIRTVEQEWNNPVPLIPLHRCWKDKSLLLQQIKKRLPPNPIQATIETEGNFDDGIRLFYQIKDVAFRLKLMLYRFLKI